MITVVVLYFLLVFIVLAPVLAVFGVQQLVIIPRLRKELIELNARRASRVQAALTAATGSAWEQPALASAHPFAGWVELMPDGRIRVGDQTFRPPGHFQVVARDKNNIPRANIQCTGTGEVLIASQGQVFQARYQDGEWKIEGRINVAK